MVTTVPFLDISRQYKRLAPFIEKNCRHVFEHCRFILGPEVREFEEKLAQFCHVREAVAVSSGTEALHIILRAEGIGEGDSVFLPSFTYAATAEVPLSLGATPVFVDVDPKTWQIDPTSLHRRLIETQKRGKTHARALIGVDLFGQPAPWNELIELARAHNLITVDDCAQSLGARYHGHPLGSQAMATALSFYPTKPLGAAGDSGAILTNVPQKAEIYRSLRSHGIGRHRYDVVRIGLNGRMDSLQAAILLSKLPFFEEELQRRRLLAARYDEAFKNYLQVPTRVPFSESTWSVYSVGFKNKAQRDEMRQHLQEAGVGTAIYYPKPLHLQTAYQSFHDGVSLPISQNLAQCLLALPLYPDLRDEEQKRVIDVVIAQLGRC